MFEQKRHPLRHSKSKVRNYITPNAQGSSLIPLRTQERQVRFIGGRLEQYRWDRGRTSNSSLQGACSSVGSALRSYAERRAFDIFHAVNFSVRPIEHIVRFNARARASSRVSQVSSNFIPDAGYNTYVRLGLSTVIGFSSDAACTRRASLPTSG